MTRLAIALTGLLLVLAGACGRVGPPLRSLPAPEPAAASNPTGGPGDEATEEEEP